MHNQMNEPHSIGICDITSFSNDEFYKERTWACIDIIDETHDPSSWHYIGF